MRVYHRCFLNTCMRVWEGIGFSVSLFLFIIAATMFTLQLQLECLHMVCSNEVVRRILVAIVDSLPAVQF